MRLKQSARYQTYSSPSARKGSRFALAVKRTPRLQLVMALRGSRFALAKSHLRLVLAHRLLVVASASRSLTSVTNQYVFRL